MATYVLIHGAASDSWYWHLLMPELLARGHDVVAPDLPCEDDSAGLIEYAETVVDAVGDRSGVVLVAQSFAGFTAPLACRRLPTKLLVMLNAMLPTPGESPGEWWVNTGWTGRAMESEQDFMDVFFHDLPAELAGEALRRGKDQSGTPFEDPWPLAAWPNVSTKVLLSRGDRFFPPEFQRRVARDRLGVIPDEMDGGHLVALSRPHELADRLEASLEHA